MRKAVRGGQDSLMDKALDYRLKGADWVQSLPRPQKALNMSD
jgi:hypothetical protein